jgi:hypothetical protein
MASFCQKCGSDRYVCQVCHDILCSKDKPPRQVQLSCTHKGNVCPACMDIRKKEVFITLEANYQEAISLLKAVVGESGMDIEEFLNRIGETRV